MRRMGREANQHFWGHKSPGNVGLRHTITCPENRERYSDHDSTHYEQ